MDAEPTEGRSRSKFRDATPDDDVPTSEYILAIMACNS